MPFMYCNQWYLLLMFPNLTVVLIISTTSLSTTKTTIKDQYSRVQDLYIRGFNLTEFTFAFGHTVIDLYWKKHGQNVQV